MDIHLLYFDGCPSWESGLANLRAALQAEGLDSPIHLVEVKDEKEAENLKFFGSPSFQVNGLDFWPEARDTYPMNCRVYRTPQGFSGWPTVEMLRQRLRELSA